MKFLIIILCMSINLALAQSVDQQVVTADELKSYGLMPVENQSQNNLSKKPMLDFSDLNDEKHETREELDAYGATSDAPLRSCYPIISAIASAIFAMVICFGVSISFTKFKKSLEKYSYVIRAAACCLSIVAGVIGIVILISLFIICIGKIILIGLNMS